MIVDLITVVTRIELLVSASLAVVLLGMAPVLAWTGTPLPGTWTITYSTTSSGAGDWPNYGSNGFPIVAPGETIYMNASVTGGTPNAYIWGELDGGNAPYPGAMYLFQTDASGDGSSPVVAWTNDLDGDFLAAVCTVPVKLAESTSSTTPGDFDGHNIDHLNIGTGSTCESAPPNGGFPPGEEVPEFPFASAIVAPLGLLAVLLVQTYRKSSIKHL